jgi:hypothetical protein
MRTKSMRTESIAPAIEAARPGLSKVPRLTGTKGEFVLAPHFDRLR